jgi:hypothetical protein
LTISGILELVANLVSMLSLIPLLPMAVFNTTNVPLYGKAGMRSSVKLTAGRLLRAAELWERRKAATAGVPQDLDSS